MDEIDVLLSRGSWDLVLTFLGLDVVGICWIYTMKHHRLGSLDRYRAELVAKRFTQTYGLDCLKTFSPLLISALLELYFNQHQSTFQLDLKNTILHDDRAEEARNLQDMLAGGNVVCKLKKAV